MKRLRLGALRARQIFLGALALQILIFLFELRHISSTNTWADLVAAIEWLIGGLITLGGILIAAGVYHFKLPKEERGSLWGMTLVYVLVLALLWYGELLGLLRLMR